MQTDDVRRSLPRRKKIQVACIILIVIVVVIAALWWYVNASRNTSGVPNVPFDMELQIGKTNGNWTCSVTVVRKVLLLDDVMMIMFDNNGVVKEPISSVKLSDLTMVNWDIYHVLYSPIANEDIIAVGATITIDRIIYPAGYDFQLYDSVTIRGSGVLQ